MEPGSIVEFFEEKRILCGVVIELKGERLRVLAQNSREFTLPPKRLLHAGPALSLERLNRQEVLKRLEETAREREALKSAINLEELWELLVQENHPTTVAELTELWFGKAAADGQMGCILKMYRDWQLSGSEELLKQLWPKIRKAVEFCWISGGWDATFGDLASVVVPEATESYVPVPYPRLVEELKLHIPRFGLSVTGERYALARDGNQLFGVLSCRNGTPAQDYCLAIGLRSSYDRSLAEEIASKSDSIFTKQS